MLLHFCVLFILFTMPFFNNNIDAHPFSGYFVFLSRESDSMNKQNTFDNLKRLPAVQKKGSGNIIPIEENYNFRKTDVTNVKEIQNEGKSSGQEVEGARSEPDIDEASVQDIAINKDLLIIDDVQQSVVLLAETEKKEEVIAKGPAVMEVMPDFKEPQDIKVVEKDKTLDTPIVNALQKGKEAVKSEQKKYEDIYKSGNESSHSIDAEAPNKKVVETRIQDITISNMNVSESNKKETIIEKRKESVVETIDKEDIPVPVISIADIFFQKDINVEIFFEGVQTPEITVRLFQKGHPKDRIKEKIKQVELKEDIAKINGKGYRVIYSVLKAEKGVYTIVFENKSGNIYTGNISFYLYRGKDKERVKIYNSTKFVNDGSLSFRFILPEAIFWDDEDYFSGSIEDSRYVTKFNYDTGLYWKEEKE